MSGLCVCWSRGREACTRGEQAIVLSGIILTRFCRRFEYKYSFKPPYLAQKDGSVPFWQYDGHAIASAENVRVTPSLRSQKGRIWTKEVTNFDWWEVELTFRVTGLPTLRLMTEE